MLQELLFAIIQAATEFLPISSSGHLALVSNIISSPDLFFFTALHIASLIAVLIFTRKEIVSLITFKKESYPLWKYWIIATIPAAIIGYLFHNIIEKTFSSLLFLGFAFAFTGVILFLTKFSKATHKLTTTNALFIGLFQAIALFPGVSRSGMTISAGLFSGIERGRAARFSFLLFIPLSIGAFILEFEKVSFSYTLLISCIVCLLLSLVFLNLLVKIIVKDKFWMFSWYCWFISLVSLLLYIFL